MQGYGQPPGDPLGNPFDDPLDDPLDPFTNDPFDAMLNSLGRAGSGMNPGETLDRLEGGIENTPPLHPGQDDISRTLDDLEETIENTPPIRPGPDALGRKLDQIEETIENLPPEGGHTESELDMPGQNHVIFGKESDNKPPLPYYLENPQQAGRSHKPPNRMEGRIGSRGGKSFDSSGAAQGNEYYCPIEDGYVTEDFCEDENCEYYNENWEQDGYDCPCTCDDKEDSQSGQ